MITTNCSCGKKHRIDQKCDGENRQVDVLLVCAFCGADMRICEETSSGSGYFYGECLNRKCGIVTPYQDTHEEVKTIITRKANAQT